MGADDRAGSRGRAGRLAAVELGERLSAVTAVPVTPFASGGGAIDEAALEALIARLDASGVRAITVLGATGEVFQLSTPERRAVIRVASAVRSNAALLAGLAGRLAEMLELAAYAAGQGFDAVMIHEPADPGGSAEGLLSLFHTVASESALPVVPYVRTPRLDESGLRELVSHPNVAAVKYAVPDLERASTLMTSGDLAERTLWICGLAETWVPAFVPLGMRGFTSGLANVEPALALAMLAAVQRGDSASVDELLDLIAPFEELRNRDRGRYNVAAIKAALAGSMEPDVRPPSARLDAAAEVELAGVLATWSSYLLGARA
jgi:4-hydroxy-tetrahydrodipicolinate synthase